MAVVRANYQARANGKAAKAATRAAKYYTYREGQDQGDRAWTVSDGRDGLGYEDVKSDIWQDGKTYGYMYRMVLSTKDADIGPEGYKAVLGDRFEKYYMIEHHNTDYPHAHVVGFRKAVLKKTELMEMREQVLELEQARAQELAAERIQAEAQELAERQRQERSRRRDLGVGLG